MKQDKYEIIFERPDSFESYSEFFYAFCGEEAKIIAQALRIKEGLDYKVKEVRKIK